jgi:hypothetical protein
MCILSTSRQRPCDSKGLEKTNPAKFFQGSLTHLALDNFDWLPHNGKRADLLFLSLVTAADDYKKVMGWALNVK